VREEKNNHALLIDSPQNLAAQLSISPDLFKEAKPIKEAIFLGWFTTTDDKQWTKHNQGLPTARFVAEYLGGTLTEEGTYGEGADFVMRINPANIRNIIPNKTLPQGMEHIKDKPLLLVEDNPDIIARYKELFTEVPLLFASSVQEALAILEQGTLPFFAIYDLELKDSSGRDLLAGMKANKHPRVKGLVHSGAIPEDIQDGEYPFILEWIDKSTTAGDYDGFRNLVYQYMISLARSIKRKET
jgi:CheY-like chemotaxis protein